VERKRFLNASGPSGSQTPLLTYHPDILFSINFYVIISRVASSASPNFFLVSTSIKSPRIPSSVDSFHLFAPYSQPSFAPSTSGVYNLATPFILSPSTFWVLDLRYARTLRDGWMLFALTISLVVKSWILVNLGRNIYSRRFIIASVNNPIITSKYKRIRNRIYKVHFKSCQEKTGK